MEGDLESRQQGTVHLDTVRALHQTVVSLRTALETSKNELKELKDKYKKHSQCENYADVIEKLSLENHILRRKIIDSGQNFNDDDFNINTSNIKLEVTYSPNRESPGIETPLRIETFHTEDNIESEEGEEEEEAESIDSLTDSENKDNFPFEEPHIFCPIKDQNENHCIESEIVTPTNHKTPDREINEPISEVSIPKQESRNFNTSCYKTKLELLSKFDVRIKVCTLKDGAVISNTTSDTESSSENKCQGKEPTDQEQGFFFEENREHFSNTKDIKGHIDIKAISTENIKMAVPSESEAKKKNEKFDVQVRITSEENLVVRDVNDRVRKKDAMNLDVDNLSLRSLSEGDNSVFSECAATPVEPDQVFIDDKKSDQENGSGNESEEVDDIELIFTTDESKDMSNLQEDLVSIKDSDWVPTNSTNTTNSTPVLVKFNTLDPDFQPKGDNDNVQNENQENASFHKVTTDPLLAVKRISLPNDKDFKHVGFSSKSLDLPSRPGILKSCDNKLDNILYKRSPNTSSRRLDSVDSLSCDYTRGLSFDTTKSSSYELGSSMDILNNESLDNFHKNAHLGHRFSVFAESDMSKCGISEEDLASANLNLRRNTCPNPFQYRPLPQRGFARPSGSLKTSLSPVVGRPRPILRADNYSVRRENGAQTDVSALPNRWSSDGYLAHKVGFNLSTIPTLPSRVTTSSSRRLTVADTKPTVAPTSRRNDRLLLSDIGFTSMVPELSRSADPLWARSNCACCAAHAQITASNTKLLSRGSSFRSPCVSIDRSSEWTPQSVGKKDFRNWRSSMPDVRGDDTDDLLAESETYLRRSIDNLRSTSTNSESECNLSRPYIPAEPCNLRLGHAVKIITPQGRIAVGRVRYVGLAGSSASDSCIMIGAIFPLSTYPWIPLNDGTLRGRRYFHTPPHHTALFVPFTKVVMAWAN